MNSSKIKIVEESRWLEIVSNLACWFGILGLLVLLSHSVWAKTPAHPQAKSAKKARKIAQTATLPPPDLDDDDDFDDDDFEPPGAFGGANPGGGLGSVGGVPKTLGGFPPPGSTSPAPGGSSGAFSGNSGSSSAGPATAVPPPSFNGKSYSAGGTPIGGPNPSRSNKGVSLGMSESNAVISNNALPRLRIDADSGKTSEPLTITDFNFPDADIMDIAKAMTKIFQVGFLFDKDVKGRMGFIHNSPVSAERVWKDFQTALNTNGFALIPLGKDMIKGPDGKVIEGEQTFRIARERDAKDKQLKTYSAGDKLPDSDALINSNFQLKYISADEVARTFRSFMPANARIIAHDQTNTVFVTDTASNITKLAKMLEVLDVEGFDAGIEVIPVRVASAAELSKLIDTLIPGTGASPGGGGQPPGVPRFGGTGKFNARRTKEGGIINTIVPDERTNTLIVHANSKGADQVRELVTKLDQKPVSQGGGKVHVVYLQFADAETLANTLSNFSQGSGSKSSSSIPTGLPGGGSGTGVNPNATTLFEGAIKVAPDKATNALVVTASPSDFVTVKRVIEKLDIPRDQVYVEVAIMEVTVGNDFSWSPNLLVPSAGTGLVTNQSAVSGLVSGNPFGGLGLLGVLKAGGDWPIALPGSTNVTIGNITGVLKAISGNSNINVLATPQIIALDNSEATFEQSQKFPIPKANILPVAGGASQLGPGVDYQQVPLSIQIKPQINKISNFVKMEVQVKLGNIDDVNVPSTLKGQAFATLDRTAKSTVVVADKDTVVLGGLIRDRVSEASTKVPILGDIPLLGWLFKSKETKVEKTNLLIFMNPNIVRQYEKIRAILDKKLKERDDFLETDAGGRDPLRGTRDNIIRSLPDLNGISERPAESTVTIDEDNRPVDSQKKSPGQPGIAPGQPSSAIDSGALPPGAPGSLSPPPGSGTPSSAINPALPMVPETAPPPTGGAPEKRS